MLLQTIIVLQDKVFGYRFLSCFKPMSRLKHFQHIPSNAVVRHQQLLFFQLTQTRVVEDLPLLTNNKNQRHYRHNPDL